MSVIETIERKLSDALGLKPRRGAAAGLLRALEALERETGMRPDDVAVRIEREPSLVRRLAGAITVEETYFERHRENFERLVEHVRKCRMSRQGSPVTIWSAGCASGEEPYTMAIAIHRALGPEALRAVRIVANDVDEVSLARARRGVYGKWSFRGTEPSLRASYFERVNRDEHRVIAACRDAVSFEHRSLDEQLATLSAGSVDVIFFRNVAIYMTEEALARVYHGFGRVLRPGGLLILGPSDPLPSSLELTRAAVERATRATPTAGLHAPLPSPISPRAPTPTPVAVAPVPAPRAPEVQAVVHRLAARARADAPDAVLKEASRLADLGRGPEALAIVDEEIRQHGASAALLGLRGRTCIAMDDARGGARDLRSALFLDPSDGLLRFHYALGLELLSRHREARSQTLDVLRSIEGLCDDDVLADGETTVGTLRRAAGELLRRVE